MENNLEQTEAYRFRSDFCHDLKLHREFNRGTRDGRLFFRFIYLYVIAIFLWMFWYLAIRAEMPEEYAKAALFSCGVWFLVESIWFLMNRGGGIHYKRSLMLNGGKPSHDTVLFYEDRILTVEQESGNKAAIQYGQIRSVGETENLLLLAMRYGTYLMVDKRGLSCTKDELGQFLYEKCPKLRRKKVRHSKTGAVLRKAAWAVVAVSFLLAIWFHPRLQIGKRLNGQIHNGMSMAEISGELASFGLRPLPGQENVTTEDSLFYLFDDKLSHLLFCMGEGTRDYDTGSFTPAETGVFFSYYWSSWPQTMYADFLYCAAALDPQIRIGNVREIQSGSSILVSFTLNGKDRQFEAVNYDDWYDEQVFNTISAMFREETGKQLYFADCDDMGCFVFLQDDAWASAFMTRTGLTLSTDINDIY